MTRLFLNYWVSPDFAITRSMTPRWPFTPLLLRSYVWLYPWLTLWAKFLWDNKHWFIKKQKQKQNRTEHKTKQKQWTKKLSKTLLHYAVVQMRVNGYSVIDYSHKWRSALKLTQNLVWTWCKYLVRTIWMRMKSTGTRCTLNSSCLNLNGGLKNWFWYNYRPMNWKLYNFRGLTFTLKSWTFSVENSWNFWQISLRSKYLSFFL